MDIQVGKAAVVCSEFPPLRHKKAWVSREYHRKNAHSGECFHSYPTQKGWPEGKKNQQQDPKWYITGTETALGQKGERMGDPASSEGRLPLETHLPKNSSRRTFSFRSLIREPPSKCLPPGGTNNQSQISQRNNRNRKTTTTTNDTEASVVLLFECVECSCKTKQSSIIY